MIIKFQRCVQVSLLVSANRVEQTSWKFHPDQERKLTRTVQISPKQKGFLEEFTALVWFNTPNSICPVTTYGKGGTRLVPAALKARGPTGSSAEQVGGQTGCPHQSSKKVPREGSAQELLRGQLRGGHFSTREQKLIGQHHPLDLQLMCRPNAGLGHVFQALLLACNLLS